MNRNNMQYILQFCTLLVLLIDINAWHSNHFSQFSRISKPSSSIQHCYIQQKGSFSLKNKFNIATSSKISSELKFKVSESEETETQVEDEVVEFVSMGNPNVLKKLKKG